MRSIERFAAFALAAMTFISLACPLGALANSHSGRGGGRPPGLGGGNPNETVIQVYNPSNPDVDVWITLPSSSNLGCGPTRLAQIQAVDSGNGANLPITQFADNQQLGFFKLSRGKKATLNPVGGASCMDGLSVTLKDHPQCPCFNTCAGDRPFVPGPNLPNGTNFVEATLNCPGSFLETVDISCVNGANTALNVTFTPGAGKNWDDGLGGNTNVTSIQNSWVNVQCSAGPACDDNCNRDGVYPYNATLCNKSGAGACPGTGSPPFCLASSDHCNIQRGKLNGNFGGTVLITYIGPVSPP